ncbi:hypothetical protein [Streptomyces atratus]|uniref:hypothetical protein n=1 Tax=Streptomyces atratus TaxID=1893 RepID=UPI0033CE8F8D
MLDEPTSALDPSLRAGILNLLMELQDTLGLVCLFLSHGMAAVRHIRDRVLTVREEKLTA